MNNNLIPDNRKIVIMGTCKFAEQAILEFGAENVLCFMDSDSNKKEFCGKSVISLDEYLEKSLANDLVVAGCNSVSDLHNLKERGIFHYTYYNENQKKIFESMQLSHNNWKSFLSKKFNKPDCRILEIGSRVVTGANFRSLFSEAEYIGFDINEGENVDVVGDAHQLSDYFDNKFDLIFSSAVFEHFSMPWIVAEEINKLLKIGGYTFHETHCSYMIHELPWFFFQFSDKALRTLFSNEMGFVTLEAGVCNPLNSSFSDKASGYLRGKSVPFMYCHSEFYGKKMKAVEKFSWHTANREKVLGNTSYPSNSCYFSSEWSNFELLWRSDRTKQFCFFGAGDICSKVLRHFEKNSIPMPLAICDNNKALHGTFIQNIPILSFEEAFTKYPDLFLLITNQNYLSEILLQVHEKIPYHKVMTVKFY